MLKLRVRVSSFGLLSVFLMPFSTFSAVCYGQTASEASLWTRQVGHDWPRMLGPNQDGHSAETGIATDWSQGKLPILWSKSLGVGYGNAVVSRGRLFQFDRYDDRERLTCCEAETGVELWRWESDVQYEDMYGYNNGPRGSAVVDDDRVYVYGVTGTLACINTVDGAQRWSIPTNKRYHVNPNFFGVGSTPVVHNNTLLVMVGGSPPEHSESPLSQAKPNGTAIVAFDKFTGKELFRVGDQLASYSAPIVKKINGDAWCFALVREGLLVFKAEDGTNSTFYPYRASIFESVNAAWPVIKDQLVFISETYQIGSALLQFDGRSLKEVWRDGSLQRNQSMRAHWATPIENGGYLYGCSGRNEPDADLRCIRLSDGAIQWVHRNRDRTTCLAVDNHLVVLGEHGTLQLIKLSPDRFELVTEIDLGNLPTDDGGVLVESPSWAPPTLAHGLLYLRGRDRLICLELIPEA